MGDHNFNPQENVLVIGHRNPDSDSICSAIAYSYLKNKINPKLHYVPCRAGDISSETQFVLDYFKMDEPELWHDISPQVRDMDINKWEGVKGSLSMRDAWNMMRETGANTLVILDDDNRMEGLITMTDIATAYMDESDTHMLAKAKTTYASLASTLDGEVIVGEKNDIVADGKLCVAAGNAAAMSGIIGKNDIVVLCNRMDSQMLAIELGAGCMIVTAGTTVPQHIKQMAERHGTKIITTPRDSYTATRLLGQSAPVSYFMTKAPLLTFSLDDRAEDVQKVMTKVRHRNFPVTNRDGSYYGMVSRRSMLDLRKKRVILVDHNELGQAVSGLENAELLEIIDHHRLGSGLQTAAPIYFRNQPVGCTCTIIYQMYQENGIVPPREVAGLMCSAILSDTLAFRSPTCTPLDQKTAETLAELAGINIDEYVNEMFEAGASLEGKTAKDIFYTDFKPFSSGDIRFGIGQSIFMSDKSSESAKELLVPYLNEVLEKEGLDMVCYMLTNVLKETTDLIFAGTHAREIVIKGFPNGELKDDSMLLANVVSRKKQMVPGLSAGISEWQK